MASPANFSGGCATCSVVRRVMGSSASPKRGVILRTLARVILAAYGISALVYATAFGSQQADSVEWGLRLSEAGSWPRKAALAWRYDNPHLRWKAFLLWENEGSWIAIDKEAHFACCYGGILTGEALGLSTAGSAAVVSAAALLNELVEWKLGFWIPPRHRGVSIKDLIVDGCGVAAGLLVVNHFCQRD